MKTVKLSKQDFSLLNYALDITASDYAVDEENPEPYKVQMQSDISKLKNKLIQMSLQSKIKFGVGNGK